jgi:hypothetical protein
MGGAVAQQFGLTNDRDLAGGTGRTGWARAGRTPVVFFISKFLLCSFMMSSFRIFSDISVHNTTNLRQYSGHRMQVNKNF